MIRSVLATKTTQLSNKQPTDESEVSLAGATVSKTAGAFDLSLPIIAINAFDIRFFLWIVS